MHGGGVSGFVKKRWKLEILTRGAVNNVLEHSRAGEHLEVRQSLVDGGGLLLFF